MNTHGFLLLCYRNVYPFMTLTKQTIENPQKLHVGKISLCSGVFRIFSLSLSSLTLSPTSKYYDFELYTPLRSACIFSATILSGNNIVIKKEFQKYFKISFLENPEQFFFLNS